MTDEVALKIIALKDELIRELQAQVETLKDSVEVQQETIKLLRARLALEGK